MGSDAPGEDPRLDRLRVVLRALELSPDGTLSLLKGDGSNRAYARIHMDGRRMVAMILSDPEPHRQAEEVGAETDTDELPFMELRGFLAARGYPVPELIAYDRSRGVLLLEDLGDTMLSDLVEERETFPERMYRKALTLLADFQAESPPRDGPAPILFRRRYGVDLWRWELEHFLEYGVESRCGEGLSTSLRARLAEIFEAIAQELAALPAVPVHRDYHSRNLMVDPRGRLRWIDFQDALLGPALYDVASLLYDAYVEIPDATRQKLLATYLDAAADRGVSLGQGSVERTLASVAVHRMLKAAGRFVYFRDIKGLGGYVEHVPALMARVQGLLALPAMAGSPMATLPDLLQEQVPEWSGEPQTASKKRP